jgi:hypothetical protein
MTPWPDSAIEAAARAMMDGSLWPGAFDGALRYEGQETERNVWRAMARAALSTIDLAGVRGQAAVAPLVWRDHVTEKYGPEWIAHHPWGSWHITYEADCEYPYVLRPFVPIGSNFQAADAAMAAATQEHERRVRSALATTPPTPDPRDAEIARLRGALDQAHAALMQARRALQLDTMVDDDGKPCGTTEVALAEIDAALATGPDGGEVKNG